MPKILSLKKRIVCCLDNNQKDFYLKYQCEDASNKFVKVTSTCAKEFIKIYDNIFLIKSNSVITYINQAVPLPYGMPKFKILAEVQNNNYSISGTNIVDTIDCVCFNVDSATALCSSTSIPPSMHTLPILQLNNQSTTTINFTGKQVQCYVSILEVLQQLENFQIQSTTYKVKNNKVEFVAHVPESLKLKEIVLAIKFIYALRKLLLNNQVLTSFQHKHTKLWNKSITKKVKLIIPPVMKNDEIKTDSYRKALIELLVFVELLKVCTKK